MPTQWKRDDRVFVKSEPEVVGTVLRVLKGHASPLVLIADDDWPGPFTGIDGLSFVHPNDLDYYTQPCPERDYTLRETLDALDSVLRYLESKIGVHAESAMDQQWYYSGWHWLTARYQRVEHELKQYGRKYEYVE